VKRGPAEGTKDFSTLLKLLQERGLPKKAENNSARRGASRMIGERSAESPRLALKEIKKKEQSRRGGPKVLGLGDDLLLDSQGRQSGGHRGKGLQEATGGEEGLYLGMIPLVSPKNRKCKPGRLGERLADRLGGEIRGKEGEACRKSHDPKGSDSLALRGCVWSGYIDRGGSSGKEFRRISQAALHGVQPGEEL